MNRNRPRLARAALTAAVRNRNTLRLAIVRFVGQFGDGMFQAALSGAILFDPQRRTNPVAIAGGFTVLLLPYSIVGPYAGALLDRWDRRLVLLVANALRAGLIVAATIALGLGVRETPLLLLALAVVGIGRFVSAGVSAALPKVVAPRWLVPMNSVLATVASGCATAGAAAAVAIMTAAGTGNVAAAVAAAGSASGSIVGMLTAVGFSPAALGPAPGEAARTTSLRAVFGGLGTGARAVWASRECTTTMIGIGTHRIVFGANTLLMVLVLRSAQPMGASLQAGLLGLGVAVGATAAGMVTAAAVTPLLIPRLGRPRTVVTALLAAAVVQLVMVAPITIATGSAVHRSRVLLLAGAFLLGLAGQTIKLTGDATMQTDVDDARRGQVFALQDTVFNIAFVLAIAVTALVIPPDGRSVGVVLTGAAAYCLAVLLVGLNQQHQHR